MSEPELAHSATPKVKVPWSGATWGFLLIRLWVGFRMLLAGVDKFEKDGDLSLETYAETTEALRSLIVEHGRILDSTMHSFFMTIVRPIAGVFGAKIEDTPEWATNTLSACVNTFASALGWVLIANGALLILGIFTRINMVLAGLIYLGLSIGLMSLPDEDGIAWLGIHMGLVALALSLSRHSKLNLTPW